MDPGPNLNCAPLAVRTLGARYDEQALNRSSRPEQVEGWGRTWVFACLASAFGLALTAVPIGLGGPRGLAVPLFLSALYALYLSFMRGALEGPAGMPGEERLRGFFVLLGCLGGPALLYMLWRTLGGALPWSVQGLEPLALGVGVPLGLAGAAVCYRLRQARKRAWDPRFAQSQAGAEYEAAQRLARQAARGSESSAPN